MLKLANKGAPQGNSDRDQASTVGGTSFAGEQLSELFDTINQMGDDIRKEMD
jgi:hypothetical protein